jgi:predicted small secreted protein
MKALAILFIAAFLLSGCGTLKDARKELQKAGYALWYPAEEGVEAGEVWQAEGNARIKQQRKPDGLEAETHAAQFETLKKTVDAGCSLDLKFTNKLLGKADEAGNLAALLKAGTVKTVDLNFGTTKIHRITLGDLREDEIRKKLPAEYLAALKKVEADNIDYVLLAAVVTSAGMKYVFKCEDTAQLQAQAPEIAKAISAKFDVSVKSKTEAFWEIPEATPLVIGILPVRGRDLGLPPEKLAKTVAANIRGAEKSLKREYRQQAIEVRLGPAPQIRFEDLR